MILIVWTLALAITCPPILGWYVFYGSLSSLCHTSTHLNVFNHQESALSNQHPIEKLKMNIRYAFSQKV